MRRIPRWSDVRPYLRMEPISGSPVTRRLAHAADIDDLRTQARRHTPRAVFDYVDGGAGSEITMRRNRASFEAIEFVPHVLRDCLLSERGDHASSAGRRRCPSRSGPPGSRA